MKSFTEIKVRGYHIDHNGHVNNSRYLEFIEESSWAYAEKNHLLEAFHRLGITHVIARIEISYKYAAKLGDHLRIETLPASRSEHSITMQHRIFDNSTGRLVAGAYVTNVYLDHETGEKISVIHTLRQVWPKLSNLEFDRQTEQGLDASR